MEANEALHKFIKSIPLFSFVDAGEMSDILRLLRPVELGAGEVLFREGEAGKAMWVLGTGVEVSISTTPKDSKRPVAVAYARAGETVGEMALVDDGVRSGTAVVVQGGHAHQIDAMEFETLRNGYQPAAFKVLRQICKDLCGRLRATTDRIVPPGSKPVETPALSNGRRPTGDEIDSYEAFKKMPAVVKLALAQKLELYDVDSITPLFAEGEIADAAWFLVSGEVGVGRNGKTLATLEAGTMFGIVGCIDQGKRSASCITLGPARLMRLKDSEFDQLFTTGNRFAFQMVDLVARQLVAHVRNANRLIPQPGRGAPPAVAPATAAPPARPRPAAVAEEIIIPFELELDVKDLEEAVG
jgi:CRP/FNR family transcriptional regulator, cyclic AMP receptor protein